MQNDQFVGLVQHRARLSSRGEAMTAIQATLQTLAERLAGKEPNHLASQLPGEIGSFLIKTGSGTGESLSLREFYDLVSLREDMPLPKAIFHARAVMNVMQRAISRGLMEDVRCQLPDEFQDLFEFPPENSAEQKHGTTRIRDIETHHPAVIGPNASLLDAAQMMRTLDVGFLPVCEGERLIGSLTDRDITIRATAAGRNPRTTKVREIMTGEVTSCYEEQSIEECAQLMERKQIRRLPVMDYRDRVVGVVSLGDLANRFSGDGLAAEVLNRVSSTAPVARCINPERRSKNSWQRAILVIK